MQDDNDVYYAVMEPPVLSMRVFGGQFDTQVRRVAKSFDKKKANLRDKDLAQNLISNLNSAGTL